MNLINMRDANGQYIVVNESEFGKAIGENSVTVFGLEPHSISAIHRAITSVGYNPSDENDVIAFCVQVTAKIAYKSEQKLNGS